MARISLLFLSIFFISSIHAQIFKAKEGGTTITFSSKAPMEEIEGVNKSAVIVLNTVTNDIQIRISVQNFKFKNALMEDQFNENYLETEKYPNAVFQGTINEKVDYSKDGETKVTVTGKMEIHGVTKDQTYEGILKKSSNEVTITSNFKVKLNDFNIKIPSLYVKNISEIVEVEIKTVLDLFQKK
ncbi:MAG: YceI family protein [Bacteroidota bacterium]|nr:YceI family protein [Bacteroidota bacterium]